MQHNGQNINTGKIFNERVDAPSLDISDRPLREVLSDIGKNSLLSEQIKPDYEGALLDNAPIKSKIEEVLSENNITGMTDAFWQRAENYVTNGYREALSNFETKVSVDSEYKNLSSETDGKLSDNENGTDIKISEENSSDLSTDTVDDRVFVDFGKEVTASELKDFGLSLSESTSNISDIDLVAKTKEFLHDKGFDINEESDSFSTAISIVKEGFITDSNNDIENPVQETVQDTRFSCVIDGKQTDFSDDKIKTIFENIGKEAYVNFSLDTFEKVEEYLNSDCGNAIDKALSDNKITEYGDKFFDTAIEYIKKGIDEASGEISANEKRIDIDSINDMSNAVTKEPSSIKNGFDLPMLGNENNILPETRVILFERKSDGSFTHSDILKQFSEDLKEFGREKAENNYYDNVFSLQKEYCEKHGIECPSKIEYDKLDRGVFRESENVDSSISPRNDIESPNHINSTDINTHNAVKFGASTKEEINAFNSALEVTYKDKQGSDATKEVSFRGVISGIGWEALHKDRISPSSLEGTITDKDSIKEKISSTLEKFGVTEPSDPFIAAVNKVVEKSYNAEVDNCVHIGRNYVSFDKCNVKAALFEWGQIISKSGLVESEHIPKENIIVKEAVKEIFGKYGISEYGDKAFLSALDTVDKGFTDSKTKDFSADDIEKALPAALKEQYGVDKESLSFMLNNPEDDKVKDILDKYEKSLASGNKIDADVQLNRDLVDFRNEKGFEDKVDYTPVRRISFTGIELNSIEQKSSNDIDKSNLDSNSRFDSKEAKMNNFVNNLSGDYKILARFVCDLCKCRTVADVGKSTVRLFMGIAERDLGRAFNPIFSFFDASNGVESREESMYYKAFGESFEKFNASTEIDERTFAQVYGGFLDKVSDLFSKDKEPEKDAATNDDKDTKDASTKVSGVEAEDESTEVSEVEAEDDSTEVSGVETEDESTEVSEVEAEDDSTEVSEVKTEDESTEVSEVEAEDDSTEVSEVKTEDESTEMSGVEAEDDSTKVSEEETKDASTEVSGVEAEDDSTEVSRKNSEDDPIAAEEINDDVSAEDNVGKIYDVEDENSESDDVEARDDFDESTNEYSADIKEEEAESVIKYEPANSGMDDNDFSDEISTQDFSSEISVTDGSEMDSVGGIAAVAEPKIDEVKDTLSNTLSNDIDLTIETVNNYCEIADVSSVGREFGNAFVELVESQGSLFMTDNITDNTHSLHDTVINVFAGLKDSLGENISDLFCGFGEAIADSSISFEANALLEDIADKCAIEGNINVVDPISQEVPTTFNSVEDAQSAQNNIIERVEIDIPLEIEELGPRDIMSDDYSPVTYEENDNLQDSTVTDSYDGNDLISSATNNPLTNFENNFDNNYDSFDSDKIDVSQANIQDTKGMDSMDDDFDAEAVESFIAG